MKLKFAMCSIVAIAALAAQCAAQKAVVNVDAGEPPFESIVIDAEGVPVEGLFTYNFWRILREAEKTNGVSRLCKIWKDATSCQAIPEGCESKMEVVQLKDGRYFVDWSFKIDSGDMPPVPRVGLAFPIQGTFTTVRWNGRGPWENYPSYRNNSKFGTYAANMSLVGDSSSNFGYRSACRWVEISEPMGRGMRIEAVNAPFGFSIRPRTDARDGFFVHIDAFVASEIDPARNAAMAPGKYRLSFLMSEL